MKLIKNAHIVTVTDKVIENGSIEIDKGRIVGVYDKNVTRKGAEIIDAKGYSVYPGFIDAHCHVGIMESGISGGAGDDTNEAIDPITPHVRAIDGINHEDDAFVEAFERGGVTSVMVAPGSANLFGGEVCFLNTKGSHVEDMLIKEEIGMKMALGENPKRVYGGQSKSPSTRMANAALIRETFYKAKQYADKKKKDKDTGFDLKMENLQKLIKRKTKARIHCHRADDIATAIRLMKEFRIPFVLEHATEGHRIAPLIAEAGIPACVGPTLTGRLKQELKYKTIDTVKVLFDHGVKVSIVTDHPIIDLYMLPVCAGYALSTGLKEEDVLKMITINPAEVCGVDDKVGSIEKGKQADLVLWKGNPLYPDSNVKKVFIRGNMVYENKNI